MHLNLWLSKNGICPICREQINKDIPATDLKKANYQCYFNDQKLDSSWKRIHSDVNAFDLIFTDDGLVAKPIEEGQGWSYVELQKVLNPGINTINLQIECKFIKHGRMYLVGHSDNNIVLFSTGLEDNKSVLYTYGTKYLCQCP